MPMWLKDSAHGVAWKKNIHFHCHCWAKNLQCNHLESTNVSVTVNVNGTLFASIYAPTPLVTQIREQVFQYVWSELLWLEGLYFQKEFGVKVEKSLFECTPYCSALCAGTSAVHDTKQTFNVCCPLWTVWLKLLHTLRQRWLRSGWAAENQFNGAKINLPSIYLQFFPAQPTILRSVEDTKIVFPWNAIRLSCIFRSERQTLPSFTSFARFFSTRKKKKKYSS